MSALITVGLMAFVVALVAFETPRISAVDIEARRQQNGPGQNGLGLCRRWH